METTRRFLHKTKVDIIAIMQCLVQRGFIKGPLKGPLFLSIPPPPFLSPFFWPLITPPASFFSFLSLHLVPTPSDARKPGSTYETWLELSVQVRKDSAQRRIREKTKQKQRECYYELSLKCKMQMQVCRKYPKMAFLPQYWRRESFQMRMSKVIIGSTGRSAVSPWDIWLGRTWTGRQ